MGSSRYDDSESIAFIFSRHEVLRRICQESAVQPSDLPGAALKINAKLVEVFFSNYMARDRRVAARS